MDEDSKQKGSLSEYERIREENIQRNREFMEKLGLGEIKPMCVFAECVWRSTATA
jgi:hypothetical protein